MFFLAVASLLLFVHDCRYYPLFRLCIAFFLAWHGAYWENSSSFSFLALGSLFPCVLDSTFCHVLLFSMAFSLTCWPLVRFWPFFCPAHAYLLVSSHEATHYTLELFSNVFFLASWPLVRCWPFFLSCSCLSTFFWAAVHTLYIVDVQHCLPP